MKLKKPGGNPAGLLFQIHLIYYSVSSVRSHACTSN